MAASRWCQLGQVRVDQGQRIAAAQNDLVHAAVSRDLPQGRFPIGRRTRPLGVGEVPPEAITAMDGAGPSCYHQNPGWILVQQPGALGRRAVANWVGAVAVGRRLFVVERKHLPQQRVASVAGTHAGDVSSRRKQRKIAGRPFRAGGVAGRQIDQPAQLGRVTHGVFEGCLPVGIARRRQRRGADVGRRLDRQPYNAHGSQYSSFAVCLQDICGQRVSITRHLNKAK